MGVFQELNRGEIRRSVGKNLGVVIDGAATSTTDTSSLVDTKNLLGGDDEHNGKEVMMYDNTGSIVDGETSIVSDFTGGATRDATVSPVFTQAITSGDKFEMWQYPIRISVINDVFNQIITEATSKKRALVRRSTTSNFTESSKYLYDWLIGTYAFGNKFRYVDKLEYAYNTGTKYTIHNCDAAWAELADPTGVTSSLDTTFKKEGSGSLKLVIAAGASTGLLKTASITSLDLSGCTEVQIWIYCTVALAAGDMQVILDNTAECVSAVESLDIPATTANTWTRHVISLANPQSDSAIISVGLKMITDKTCTLWADDIIAQDPNTINYRELSPEYWDIVHGASPLLQLTYDGLSVVGENRQMRLSGYTAPDLFTDDTTDCEIDPAYVIAAATGHLLIAHPYSSNIAINNREAIAKYWLDKAERMNLFPSMPGSAREV